jgi:hypothetical protein
MRANPYLIETIEASTDQQNASGQSITSRLAALEAAVANLQAMLAATAGNVTISDESATFTSGTGTATYAMTVSGSVTATDVYAKTYHTLCPYSVRVGDGKEVLHISEAGNMGVGTGEPQARLHVVGDLVVEGRVIVRDGGGN